MDSNQNSLSVNLMSGTSSSANLSSLNLEMAKEAIIVTDWQKFFFTAEDQSLQYYPPIKADSKL